MRFMSRAVTGLALGVLTLALLAGGAWRVMDAIQARAERPARTVKTRPPVVNAILLEAVVANPQLTAYGEVRSWRTLEVRSPLAGRLVQVSERFRDGAPVESGYTLFVIDPSDSESRRLDARTSMSEAQAEVAEAREAILAAEQELSASKRQLQLRSQALKRQRSLKQKGYATDADLEGAELAYASADQAVLNRSQMIITARKRIERAALRRERADNALDEAERDVVETRVTAPFNGVLTGVSAILGRLVGVNEKLAELVDPAALEVTFRLSNRQFARLLGDNGALAQQPLTAVLKLGEKEVTAGGQVDRVDAVVGAGQSGRRLVARLDVDSNTVLRPGDFVTVRIVEPPLRDVADVPATAATEDGRILLVDDAGIVSEITATVARRQGDRLLLADVPFGARIITQRLPQLAPGVLVEVRDANTSGATAKAQPETITLDAARREALIATVSAARRLPEDRRAKILDLLSHERVPTRVVERIEKRMGQRGL
jgi:membrane fusion protein (multidrug efflux system)